MTDCFPSLWGIWIFEQPAPRNADITGGSSCVSRLKNEIGCWLYRQDCRHFFFSVNSMRGYSVHGAYLALSRDLAFRLIFANNRSLKYHKRPHLINGLLNELLLSPIFIVISFLERVSKYKSVRGTFCINSSGSIGYKSKRWNKAFS